MILQCSITDLDAKMKEAIEMALQIGLPKTDPMGTGQKGAGKGSVSADPDVLEYETYVGSLSGCITERELPLEIEEKKIEGLIEAVLTGFRLTFKNRHIPYPWDFAVESPCVIHNDSVSFSRPLWMMNSLWISHNMPFQGTSWITSATKWPR